MPASIRHLKFISVPAKLSFYTHFAIKIFFLGGVSEIKWIKSTQLESTGASQVCLTLELFVSQILLLL